MAERSAVDRKGAVPDFITVGPRIAWWRLHVSARPRFFRGFHFLGAEERLPFVRGKKDFAVVTPGFVRGFDEHERELARVRAAVQIRPGKRVRVHPPCPRRLRREDVAALAARRHVGCALFCCTIDLRRHELTMPVHEFRHIGIVDQLDRDGFAFPQSDDGTGHAAVVCCRADDEVRRKLHQYGRDPDRQVRRTICLIAGPIGIAIPRTTRRDEPCSRTGADAQKVAPGHLQASLHSRLHATLPRA